MPLIKIAVLQSWQGLLQKPPAGHKFDFSPKNLSAIYLITHLELCVTTTSSYYYYYYCHYSYNLMISILLQHKARVIDVMRRCVKLQRRQLIGCLPVEVFQACSLHMLKPQDG